MNHLNKTTKSHIMILKICAIKSEEKNVALQYNKLIFTYRDIDLNNKFQ